MDIPISVQPTILYINDVCRKIFGINVSSNLKTSDERLNQDRILHLDLFKPMRRVASADRSRPAESQSPRQTLSEESAASPAQRYRIMSSLYDLLTYKPPSKRKTCESYKFKVPNLFFSGNQLGVEGSDPKWIQVKRLDIPFQK